MLAATTGAKRVECTSDEFIVAYTDEFVHGSTGHVLCDDDGARYTKDRAETRLSVFITNPLEIALSILKSACLESKFCQRRGRGEGWGGRRAPWWFMGGERL